MDEPQLERLGLRRRPVGERRERRPAGVPVDRPAVVGVHERERLELVALVDVGHPGDGELEQGLRERVRGGRPGAPPPRTGRRSRGTARGRRARARSPGPPPRAPRPARSSSSPAWPRASPSRGRPRGARARSARRPRASGRRGTPRRASARRRRAAARTPRATRARARPTRSAIPASAPIRARTSPERFVSWVCVTSRLSGKRAARSALAAWKAATAIPNRDGSPPTSLSASRRT